MPSPWTTSTSGVCVQFHESADGSLDAEDFACEPYGVASDAVHGNPVLDGTWSDERSFDGLLVTTLWCDGGDCPT